MMPSAAWAAPVTPTSAAVATAAVTDARSGLGRRSRGRPAGGLGWRSGVTGHLWKGMSRSDVKELGELIDEGDAALVVVGESKLEQYLDRVYSRATKRLAKEIKSDPDAFAASLAANE